VIDQSVIRREYTSRTAAAAPGLQRATFSMEPYDSPALSDQGRCWSASLLYRLRPTDVPVSCFRATGSRPPH
jgi:hypothetical protein